MRNEKGTNSSRTYPRRVFDCSGTDSHQVRNDAARTINAWIFVKYAFLWAQAHRTAFERTHTGGFTS